MASSPSVLQAPAKPDFRHEEGALRSAASTHDGLARSPNFDAPPPEHRPRLPSISTISQDTSPQSPSTASTSTPASGHSSALGPVVAFQCPSERCKNNPMWRFSRLDIFKMHVQRCHPEEDVDRLIARSGSHANGNAATYPEPAQHASAPVANMTPSSTHGSMPQFGRTKAYKCALPKCNQREKTFWRLDHFKSHISRMHPQEDKKELIERSERYEHVAQPMPPERKNSMAIGSLLDTSTPTIDQPKNYYPTPSPQQFQPPPLQMPLPPFNPNSAYADQPSPMDISRRASTASAMMIDPSLDPSRRQSIVDAGLSSARSEPSPISRRSSIATSRGAYYTKHNEEDQAVRAVRNLASDLKASLNAMKKTNPAQPPQHPQHGAATSPTIDTSGSSFSGLQQRPLQPRLYCPHCSTYPSGFRSEHELLRHTRREHAKTRKVWVTVDASADGNFLTSCRSCMEGKRYSESYNAASHLRRMHFCPKKRRRPGEKDSASPTELRPNGSFSGGAKRVIEVSADCPPMEVLKDKWLREVEEVIRDDMDVDGGMGVGEAQNRGIMHGGVVVTNEKDGVDGERDGRDVDMRGQDEGERERQHSDSARAGHDEFDREASVPRAGEMEAVNA